MEILVQKDKEYNNIDYRHELNNFTYVNKQQIYMMK